LNPKSNIYEYRSCTFVGYTLA